MNGNDNDNKSKSILDEVMSSREEDILREFNPYETVAMILKGLGKRESHILTKRFSLDGRPSKTLEEIGKLYGITRERVRQIQSSAIRELQDQGIEKKTEVPVKAITLILEGSGGIMEENSMVKELLSEKDFSPLNKYATLFIMQLSPSFDEFSETEIYNKAWGLRGASLEIPRKVIEVFIDILKDKNEPVHHDSVVEHVKGHDKFNEVEDRIQNDHIHTHLEISKKVKRNPFGEWGLSHWDSIAPRGVRDKAYLVLRKNDKPLHFRDIAKHIDKAGFDSKKAHPQTVHNELIKDGRFVLVGRGLYGLTSWGYKPGTVADVIERVLRNAGRPMTKEEILEGVLKERFVKNNTVLLGLQSKDRFRRLEDGRYGMNQ